jgi:hypothetical protein
VNQGYEAFCMVDPVFYDAMRSEATAGVSFATANRPLPYGWRQHEQDDWLVFRASHAAIGEGADRAVSALPEQGWKIHVSACLDNADRILDAVWDYCLPRKIDFKFLRSPAALLARVSKYADRAYSGKLVTIYPVDDAACETILAELGDLLDGEPSPYILSDLRWGSGPLYVRYGGFAIRHCLDEDGEPVAAIADDTGRLVPDRRDPVFYVPPWVTLPEFLAPHLEARSAATVDDVPYAIERVVHFSNGGGVYVGRDKRSGEQVVLKEARPHAGLDAKGHDAVRRLEREHDMLQRLSDLPGVPAVNDLFTLGEHRFCVLEFVDGDPLNTALVKRYPLTDPTAGPERFVEFTDWAMDVYEQVETTIKAINERGIVYGDLHLFNPMVRPDGRVVLLDFEVAAEVEDATRPGLGNQGFAAPREMTGFEIDAYALACLKVALFLPMTQLLGLHRPKVRQFADVIAAHFPIPLGYLEPAVELIAGPEEVPVRARTIAATPPSVIQIEPDPATWPRLRNDLSRAIVASATPERDDRLFPGDIMQFEVGGLGLAYGAAGVLYALDVAGAGRYPELEDWLVRHAATPPSGTRPGLFDGLHGAAFGLEHLGYRQEALDVLDVAMQGGWESLGLDLAGGLAGIGLNLLHCAERTGEPALRQAGRRTADLVADRLGGSALVADDVQTGDLPSLSGGGQPWAGLLQGSAGPALLLLRAFDEFGDPSYLDQAAVALRQDLRRCIVRENDALEVNEGWRTMPYLGRGSVGIGLVLDEYLARSDDEQFAVVSRQIERVAQSPLYIQPGLFAGRAGILAYLAGKARVARSNATHQRLNHLGTVGFDRTTSSEVNSDVARQVRALAWHALPYSGGTAFPGHDLLRLSMDLATGTAGVLLSLAMALHDEPVNVPVLGLTDLALATTQGLAVPAASSDTPAPVPLTPVVTGAGS